MREDSGAPSGRENASSCRAASFRTRSREHDTSELSLHEICDTNTERVSQSDKRLREQQGHCEKWDQELKNGEGKKRLEGGRRERNTHLPGLGRKRHDSWQRRKKQALKNLVSMEGEGERI